MTDINSSWDSPRLAGNGKRIHAPRDGKTSGKEQTQSYFIPGQKAPQVGIIPKSTRQ